MNFLNAANLMTVEPVTDEILMLEIREGHIDYNGVNVQTGAYETASVGNNIVYYDELLTESDVDTIYAFSISSSDDPIYNGITNPTTVGYKAKGTDINNRYDNNAPKLLRTWWVFLRLPYAMQAGKTYTIDASSVTGASGVREMTFNEEDLRSPTIHISQLGFTPNSPKFAYLSQWMGTSGPLDLQPYSSAAWQVIDVETGIAVLNGTGFTLQKAKGDVDNIGMKYEGVPINWTQADIYEIDLSSLQTEGLYKLAVDGIGSSLPFRVKADVYREAYRAAMRSLFFQRMGIQKDVPEFGIEYPYSRHPDRGHVYRLYPDYMATEPGNWSNYTSVDVTSAAAGNGYDPNTGLWGWYADAGDWDYYGHRHFRVPFSLTLAYLLNPTAHFDGDVGNRYRIGNSDVWIEEGNNGIPDILDEARWLVDFAKRSRDFLIETGYGTGGVPSYIGPDAGADLPSWDVGTLYEIPIGGESVESTYDYAAAAAMIAYAYKKYNIGSSSEWMTLESDAIEAWNWGEAHLPATASFSDNMTFGDMLRARYMAAVALYGLTGEKFYEIEYFNYLFGEGGVVGDTEKNYAEWGASNWSQMASAFYLLSAQDHPNYSSSIYSEVENYMIGRGDITANYYDEYGFRMGGIAYWQSSLLLFFSIPRGTAGPVAHWLTGSDKYINDLHGSIAYLLGGDPTNRSRMTGIGYDREYAPFHPDSWWLLDFNHPAYRNPFLPGISTLGLPGFDVGGPGSELWTRESSVPSLNDVNLSNMDKITYPLSEQRFFSRYSIAGSEFTIYQNQIKWIYATSYLLDPGGAPVAAYVVPDVTLNIEDVSVSSSLYELTATTSSETHKVQYFAGWKFIGESTERNSDFLVTFNPNLFGFFGGDEVRITAIAKTWEGELSQPTPAGESMLTIGAGSVSNPTFSGNELVNGDFSTNLNSNTGDVYETDAGLGWFIPVNSRWQYDSSNSQVYMDGTKTNGAQNIIQIVEGSNITGLRDVMIRAASTDTGVDNQVRIGIWGVTGPDVKISHWLFGGFQMGTASLLADSSFLGAFVETDYILPGVDFGTGYDYVVVDVWGGYVNEGDRLAASEVVIEADSNVLINGDFTSALNTNTGEIFETDVGEGWHVPVNTRWQHDSNEGYLYMDGTKTNGSRNVIQIIDGSGIAGLYEMAMQASSIDGGMDNEIRVGVWGVNGTQVEITHWLHGHFYAGQETRVLDVSEVGSYNLSEYSYPLIDFGAGYDYVVIVLWGDYVNEGDRLVVTNVELMPSQ
ncbi:cellulase N-terminal Ig-like domain-containing protein [Cerasicoccus frondis]|uniref:cellulase N-terminal Ig-like domain-containing protein n=1 Tax=Cerasicoccus frondis TaxID=490090 RepID=UPI0028528281|nr:cellulase N-terminal Ig-like domain-containing protein [Cerasicoccus frondis]